MTMQVIQQAPHSKPSSKTGVTLQRKAEAVSDTLQQGPSVTNLFAQCPGVPVDDVKVQNWIDIALSATGGDVPRARVALHGMRDKACCDVDMAAAEHYLYAREQVGTGLIPFEIDAVRMTTAILAQAAAKIVHLMPRTGRCPVTRFSTEQLNWEMKGVRDGASDAETTRDLKNNATPSTPQPTTSPKVPVSQSAAAAPFVLQTKLTVNTIGDKYEQEADRVAEQVMRMPEPKVQRQCACGKSSTEGECSECKKKKQESIGTLQRVASSRVGGIAAPPIVDRVLRSQGAPLPESARTFMESRFGQDFSHVKVHTDQQAVESAATVQARAYTVGSSIVFGRGANPSHDQFLLAHELTHVLQQTSAPGYEVVQRAPTGTSRKSGTVKLVLYQELGSTPDGHWFRKLANEQAKRIGAHRVDASSEGCLMSQKGIGHATPFSTGEDIVSSVEKAHACSQHQISEFHIFSHGYRQEIKGEDGYRTGFHIDAGLFAETISFGKVADIGDLPKDAFSPDVKVVLHGCKLAEGGEESMAGELWKGLSKTSPKARVLGHSDRGDAGATRNDWLEFSEESPKGAKPKRRPFERVTTTKPSTKKVRRSAAAPGPEFAPAIVYDVISSPGCVIDSDNRTLFESRFGQDFSQVRIHTDSQAQSSAKDISANAYTVGQHIVFGQGQYKPDSSEGQHLLAHELTHVMQQTERSITNSPVAQRQALSNFAPPEDELHEAIAGPGTNESVVFRILDSVKGNIAAIENLEGRYNATYGDLIDDLRGDLSPEEYQRARQVLVPTLQDAHVLDCDSAENPSYTAKSVRKAHARAVEILLIALMKSVNLSDPDVQVAARRYFKITLPPATDEDKRNWTHVRNALLTMATADTEAVYECESDGSHWDGLCGGGNIATAIGNIHICPPWWSAGSVDHRAAFLVHEWGHKFGNGVARLFETYCHQSDYPKATAEELVSWPDAHMQFVWHLGVGAPAPCI